MKLTIYCSGEIQSVDSDPDVAGPKVPDSVKNEKDEPVKKKKRIVLTEDDNESEFIIITQLTRPFTVKAFQVKIILKIFKNFENFARRVDLGEYSAKF